MSLVVPSELASTEELISSFEGPHDTELACGIQLCYSLAMETTETSVDCPYCGEPFTIVVDTSIPTQTYIEDCYICCRPIKFTVVCNDEGQLESIEAARD